MRIIVIGGGASGLVASILAAKGGNEVIILEKNNHCGKKILVTGSGRCNYFNDDFTISHYRSENIDRLEKIINADNKRIILDFFEGIGIVPKIKDGYYYPYSNAAISVRESLVLQARVLGVKILNEVNVSDIKHNGKKFEIKTDNGDFIADKVVLATGSKAMPTTGSDGFGYELCERFGHKIIKPLPALVGVKGEGNYFSIWNGIRTEVSIELIENDKVVERQKGEIQLTDYGVSGICVFQLSGRIARGLASNMRERVRIDFLPWLEAKNYDDVTYWLDVRNKRLKGRNVSELLDGVLNYKLSNAILKKSGIEVKKHWNELDDSKRIELAKNLKWFEMKVVSINSFEKAQVCSGGVSIDEVNIYTMESLKQKGLYIVGELLDVVGDCGGYNLGFAWLSGILAGMGVVNND